MKRRSPLQRLSTRPQREVSDISTVVRYSTSFLAGLSVPISTADQDNYGRRPSLESLSKHSPHIMRRLARWWCCWWLSLSPLFSEAISAYLSCFVLITSMQYHNTQASEWWRQACIECFAWRRNFDCRGREAKPGKSPAEPWYGGKYSIVWFLNSTRFYLVVQTLCPCSLMQYAIDTIISTTPKCVAGEHVIDEEHTMHRKKVSAR